jgi:hypothetical protein
MTLQSRVLKPFFSMDRIKRSVHARRLSVSSFEHSEKAIGKAIGKDLGERSWERP